jgi:hypothetical protein
VAAGDVWTLDDLARRRLRRIDTLLEQLENLNLFNCRHLPERLVEQLEHLGIDDPYANSITGLIDRVFELEQPLLELIHGRPFGPG